MRTLNFFRMLLLAVFVTGLGYPTVTAQTITIGGNEYAFQYNSNTNYGMYFNLTAARYELRNGTGTSVFSVNANTGQVLSQGIQNTGNITNTGNIQFGASGDLLIGANRYAFRYSAGTNYGLFFNATQAQYEFRNGSAVSVFSVNANTGNAVLAAGLQIGNSSLANAGNIRWNGTDFQGYNGTSWVSFTSGGGGGATGPTGPQGPAGPAGPQGPAGPLVAGTVNQTLRNNGTTWEASSALVNTGTNVGVGTTNPNATLNVVSDQDLASSTAGNADLTNAQMKIRSTFGSGSGQMVGIGFTVSTVPNATGAAILHERSGGNSQGKLHFATKSITTATDDIPIRMTIDQNGDVGIGTLTPDNRLTVSGTANITGNLGIGTATPTHKLTVEGGNIRVNGTTTAFVQINGGTSNSGVQFLSGGDSKGYLWWDATGNRFRLSASAGGGSEHLTVLQNGNVGIGTGAPTERFHVVSGNARVNDRLLVGGDVSSVGARLYVTGNGTDAALQVQQPSGTTRIFVSPNGGVGINAGVTNVDAGRTYIGGNIAMGSNTFATGYRLSVNGRIICTELKVQAVGSWPDYVFSPEYNLPSINEVEAFIKENGHLPNIPSAKQVEEEDGISVGEMSKKMMEKIEELTLYMIDANKKIEDLARQNQELRSEVKSLKNNKK